MKKNSSPQPQHKLIHLLKQNWDTLLIVLITTLIFVTVFIPFIAFNSLDKYDTPGLLSLSWFIAEYRFPDFQGWNPYFFAGFPQGILYPPLFHYLIAGLSKIFSLELSYKLVITTAGLLIPISIHSFTKTVYRNKSWALLGSLSILITLLALPGYLGFNYDGMLDYGLGPSFITIPVFFFFLCSLFRNKRSARLLASLFSIMLLTNLVATLVAGIITIIYAVMNIKNKDVLIRMAKFPLLVGLLSLFWTLPYLVWHSWGVSGYPIQGSGMISILAIVLSGSALSLEFYIAKRRKQRLKLSAILLTGFLFALLNIVDMVINRDKTVFSFGSIHPLRLQIFSFLAFAISLPLIIKNLHPILLIFTKRFKVMKLFKRMFHMAEIHAFLIIFIIILTIIRLQPRGVEKIEFDNPPEWEGRVMRVYKVTEVLDQSRAVIDRSVMDYPNAYAVDGLLKESSYLAPYFQSLAKSLNSKNYDWKILDEYYIENNKVPREKVPYLMDLLWVKNLFTIDPAISGCSDWSRLASFETNSLKDGIIKRDMYLCSYAPTQDSSIIDVLLEKPRLATESWESTLQKWWLNKDTKLFSNEKLPKDIFEEIPIRGSMSIEYNKNLSQLKIKNKDDKSFPVLVKMNYFPKWKAISVHGDEVKIYRVSPNFMAFPLDEEVTLSYQRTPLEIATLVLSIASWILLCAYTLAYKYIKFRFRINL